MTQPHDDWSDLSQAWTTPSADDAERTRADAAFIRSLQRRDRLARLNFIGEILGGVVVAGVVVWTAMRNDLPLSVTLAAFGFIVFGLAVTLWSRRGDPGVMTRTPQAVLRSAIAQARMGERWGIAGIGMSLAAFVFMAVIANTDSGGGKVPWLYPVFIGFLGVCIVAYGLHALRCRRRRARHEAALAALEDAAAGEP